MSEYEITRQRHVEFMMGRLPEHLERLTWSVDRLRAERTVRLRELLRTARTHSPWHRGRLSTVDFDVIDEDRLRELPVMTKTDLMTHFDEIVTDRRVTLDLVNAHLAGLTSDAYLLDEFHALASGGSSGVRGVFVWGWEAWAVCWLMNLRRQMGDSLTSRAVSRMCSRIPERSRSIRTYFDPCSGETRGSSSIRSGRLFGARRSSCARTGLWT